MRQRAQMTRGGARFQRQCAAGWRHGVGDQGLKVKGSSLVVKVAPRSRTSASSRAITTSIVRLMALGDAVEVGVREEGVADGAFPDP